MAERTTRRQFLATCATAFCAASTASLCGDPRSAMAQRPTRGLLKARLSPYFTPLAGGEDTTLQAPLMIAFFTSIGFGASVPLLRSGGPAVALFLGWATVMAVAQNVGGAAIAAGLGVPPLLGVLAGSVALTGGPATALAFAPLFEQAGVAGAATLGVASAMVGIVSGGIIGGPIGTFLIERHGLRPASLASAAAPPEAATAADAVLALEAPDPVPPALAGEDPGARALLKGVVSLLAAMAVGSWIGAAFTALGVTLPAYIGAMLAAAALRNLDDLTHVIGLSQKLIDHLGTVALSLFLVLALMTLKLWEVAGLALPLLAVLAAQVALIALVCLPIPRDSGIRTRGSSLTCRIRVGRSSARRKRSWMAEGAPWTGYRGTRAGPAGRFMRR